MRTLIIGLIALLSFVGFNNNQTTISKYSEASNKEYKIFTMTSNGIKKF